MTVAEKKKYLLEKETYGIDDLVTVVEVLRSEEGCPWDKEQTHKSIRKDFIEETYEVIEAIYTEDPVLLREELGDVLLQVTFHTQIEKEKGVFTLEDVANDVCVKLIHRHPHVFGDVIAETSDKVLANWEVIKSEEKERRTVTDKLRSIPPMLPALMRAEKVGKKASCFDFPDADSVMLKVKEELAELEEAILKNDKENIEEEAGDLIFSVVSLCRKLSVEPEVALNKATDKFIKRFADLESAVAAEGKDITKLEMAELDEIWERNKKNL
ncbi:MAG: nucleoside triphosphate pyrophosphohydrolase [Clostridia bacterium]|nr:nucleoside triphosphate pyrophosphohydrolase [Clostridia bacterium]